TIYTDTLAVQNGFTSFTVTAFAVDAGGRRALSPPVTVTVQTPGNDLTPPAVSHSISSPVEVNDNVTVHATDPSGISWIGFRVDTALNAAPPFTGIVALKVDTVNVSAGNLTTVDSTFALALPLGDSALPKSVVVRGYACDLATARNCAYSQTSTVITGTAARPRALGIGALSGSGVDTVIVVAGITRPLPLGRHRAVDPRREHETAAVAPGAAQLPDRKVLDRAEPVHPRRDHGARRFRPAPVRRHGVPAYVRRVHLRGGLDLRDLLDHADPEQ